MLRRCILLHREAPSLQYNNNTSTLTCVVCHHPTCCVQSISVGSCQLVFLLAGQLYLVAVSSRGEAPAALRRQLELLYQSILMVVTGGAARGFTM
jgi:hypothetical protein